MVRIPDGGGVHSVPRDLLVGREQPQRLLAQAFQAALSGAGSLVLIRGEAGIGKTRLTRELAAQAADRAIVLSGRTWESGDAPPFWPFVQVLRSLVDQLTPEELTRLLGPSSSALTHLAPELARFTEPDPTQHEAPSRFEIFDCMVRLLANVSRAKPVLVILDDLHAADEGTTHLASFLATAIGNMAVLVVATAEPRGGAPLEELRREAQVVELQRLDRIEIATMYESIAETAPSEPLLDALEGATEGNPFFIREAVRLLVRDGNLHRPDLSTGFRVPEGAREVLRRRLERLGEPELQVLSFASVLGRDFDATTVAEIAGRPVPEVLDLLGHAVEAGIVTEVSTLGRFSFSHVLMRETLYESLTMSDRMRIHQAAVDAIEERFRDDLDTHVEELAHHSFKAAQAGDRQKTIDYTMQAAERARASTAFEQAARLYERALKVAELGGIPTTTRAKIKRALAESRKASAQEPELASSEVRMARNAFERRGDYWAISYEGRRFDLKGSKGLQYLVQLLKNPGSELHALELIGLVDSAPRGSPGGGARSDGLAAEGGDLGEILDPQAKALYKRRLEELRSDVEEAESFNDPERAEAARSEMDALLEQLAEGLGMRGKQRKSEVERARTSITKAIRSSLERIEKEHPDLGAHLRTTIRTGTFCSYTPDPRSSPAWSLKL